MKVGDIVQHHFKGKYAGQTVGDRFTIGRVVAIDYPTNSGTIDVAQVHFGKKDNYHYVDLYWVDKSELTIIGESNETN